MQYFKAIIGISLLIILHELGHYLIARLCGMRILKFSVGFGPALLKRRIGETDWQLAAIPLGGFVQIDGMGPVTEQDAPPDQRTFRSKPVWQRLSVIAAGPMMNWLLAAVFISIVAVTVGFTRTDENSSQISEVVGKSPAALAGFKAGDRILAIAGAATENWADVRAGISANLEKAVVVEIARGEKNLAITVTPKKTGLGVVAATLVVRVGVVEGIGLGFYYAWRNTARQAGMLWGMLTGTQEGELSGIGAIVQMAANQAARGLEMLLQFLAWLSIGLFLLNLVPLPALDGGRLVFLAVEAIRGRPINQQVEGMVHGIGFLLLMGLIIVVTLRDCVR